MTPNEFAALIERSIIELQPKLEVGLDKIGELAETLAASYIGTEQGTWPPLAESTILRQGRQGICNARAVVTDWRHA